MKSKSIFLFFFILCFINIFFVNIVFAYDIIENFNQSTDTSNCNNFYPATFLSILNANSITGELGEWYSYGLDSGSKDLNTECDMVDGGGLGRYMEHLDITNPATGEDATADTIFITNNFSIVPETQITLEGVLCYAGHTSQPEGLNGLILHNPTSLSELDGKGILCIILSGNAMPYPYDGAGGILCSETCNLDDIDDGTDFFDSAVACTIQGTTFTGQNLLDNCSLSSLPSSITAITFIHDVDSDWDGGFERFHSSLIRKMEFLNVSLVGNDLPVFNISYDTTSFCINDTGQEVMFNFTINATDTENDTIYYALERYNYFRRRVDYYEDFVYYDNNGECKLDYDFFKTNNFISNYSLPLLSNLWAVNLFNLRNYFSLVLDVDELENCFAHFIIFDEIDRFIIKPDFSLFYDSELWHRIRVNTNNTIFSMIFRENTRQKIFNLTFNQTLAGNLTVFFEATFFETTQILNTEYNNDDWITVYIQLNNTDNRIFVNIYWENFVVSGYLYNTTIPFRNFDSILYETLDTVGENEWTIRDYVIETSNYVLIPRFSSVKPNFYILNQTGTQYIQVYISDDKHQPYSSVTETIPVTVILCEEYIEKGLDWIEDRDYREYTYNLKSSIISICGAIDNSNLGQYGDGQDTHSKINFCSLLIIFYSLLAVLFAIFMHIISRNFLFTLFSWSFFMIWGTVLFDFDITYSIIIGFIFSISLAFLILRLFMHTGETHE